MGIPHNLFRIQYASDLHLELYVKPVSFESILKPVAPYLALAGDVGHPEQLKELFHWAAPEKWTMQVMQGFADDVKHGDREHQNVS